MPMMFDGETDTFVYAQFNGIRFHILLAFRDVVCGAGYAAKKGFGEYI